MKRPQKNTAFLISALIILVSGYIIIVYANTENGTMLI